ncbi:hypothetical protein D3C80_2034160 [compost metagenome]
MSDAVVCQVRQQLACRDQGHARKQAGHAGENDPANGRRRSGVSQGHPCDLRDTGKRYQREHRANRRQYRSGDQAATDRGEHAADGAARLGGGKGSIGGGR